MIFGPKLLGITPTSVQTELFIDVDILAPEPLPEYHKLEFPQYPPNSNVLIVIRDFNSNVINPGELAQIP